MTAESGPNPWDITPEMEEIFKITVPKEAEMTTKTAKTHTCHDCFKVMPDANKNGGRPKKRCTTCARDWNRLKERRARARKKMTMTIVPDTHEPVATIDGFNKGARVIATTPDIDVEKAMAEEQEAKTIRGTWVPESVSDLKIYGDMVDFSQTDFDDDDPVTDEDIEWAARIALANPGRNPYSALEAIDEETPVLENPYKVGDRAFYRPKNEVSVYEGTIDKVDDDMVFIKLDSLTKGGVNRVGCRCDSSQIIQGAPVPIVPVAPLRGFRDTDDKLRMPQSKPLTRYERMERDNPTLAIPIEHGAMLIDKSDGTVLRVEQVDGNDVIVENLVTRSRFHVPANLVSDLGKVLGEL